MNERTLYLLFWNINMSFLVVTIMRMTNREQEQYEGNAPNFMRKKLTASGKTDMTQMYICASQWHNIQYDS